MFCKLNSFFIDELQWWTNSTAQTFLWNMWSKAIRLCSNVQYHRLWPILFMWNPGSMKREQYTIIPILMVRLIKDFFLIILCHNRTVENTESVWIEFPHPKSFPTQNFISGFNISSHSKLQKITHTYHTTWLVSSFR